MNRYYFTFGSSDSHPYPNKYLIVEADNQKSAQHIFRSKYPDKVPGTLNCAFIYNEEQWQKATANHSMECVEVLKIVSTKI
jgi:hypothetical protein